MARCAWRRVESPEDTRRMDIDNLIAIDMHTHLEVSCRNPFDSYGE